MKPTILEGESLEEFNNLSQEMYSLHAPINDAERRMVDMMIQHEWLMRRALRMQQHLTPPDGSEPDEKRLKLFVQYYKTHERSYAFAKRQLDDMRKHMRQMEALNNRRIAEQKKHQRQWEQILKKMPTLTDWVN